MAAVKQFFVALGANLPSLVGRPAATLHAVVERLQDHGLQHVKSSHFYRTPCFPPGAGPDYVNAVVKVDFDGFPEELLKILHEIESEFGRERLQRWGQRVLDLDLIAAGDQVRPDRPTFLHWLNLPSEQQRKDAPNQLILPHPRLQDRAFVLVPFADVAPDWRHPVLGLTVSQMLANLEKSDIHEVRRI